MMLAYRFSLAKQVSQDMLTTFNDNSDLLKKVSRVWVCSSIFYYSKKMDLRNCIKFCVKN